MKNIETVRRGKTTYAIIIRAGYDHSGIQFFTPIEFSQQFAYMRHPVGKVIDPHVHNAVARQVHFTNEVLFIRKGRLRVDFYSDQRNYLESRVLNPGDVILLSGGGHGFHVLEEVEMFEVKQGPYAGDNDKTRFPAVDENRITLGESDSDV